MFRRQFGSKVGANLKKIFSPLLMLWQARPPTLKNIRKGREFKVYDFERSSDSNRKNSDTWMFFSLYRCFN
jgi:hypothetical protein